MKVKWLIKFKAYGDHLSTVSGKVPHPELLKIQSPGYPSIHPESVGIINRKGYGYREERNVDGTRTLTAYIQDIDKMPETFRNQMTGWMRSYKMNKIL